MYLLLILGLLVGSLILIPLLLVGLVLRIVVGVALLPFRLAGFAIRLSLGLVFGLIALILAGTVLLIPLLPVIAVVFLVWLIFRPSRRQPAAGLITG
jgi:hypothetical protein